MLDGLALVHLLSLPVEDQKRNRRARDHLLAAIELSRASWAIYAAEEDNDREWIPYPGQTGFAGARVDKAMVDQWRAFLDEAESTLRGELLVSLWRGRKKDEGGNLARVFTEPTRLHVILWVQGSAALPYLEQGEIAQPNFWQRVMSAFDGNFLLFAIWFN
ncbi:MAG: hypothetical protein R6U98_36655 [Pirellulaceae bacterium]